MVLDRARIGPFYIDVITNELQERCGIHDSQFYFFIYLQAEVVEAVELDMAKIEKDGVVLRTYHDDDPPFGTAYVVRELGIVL